MIVVDSPDPKLFEQAIFIIRNDALTKEGVTPQQVLGEACRIARGYAAGQMVRPPLWRRIPRWCYFARRGPGGGGSVAGIHLPAVSKGGTFMRKVLLCCFTGKKVPFSP